MREYELAVLLHPDLEIDQDKALAKLENIISDLNGKVINRDDWGKRKLAYAISKQQFALYFLYHLELDPSSVKELERNLQIAGEVIRYLVVKYEPPQETVKRRGSGQQPDKEKAKPKAATKSTKTATEDKQSRPAKLSTKVAADEKSK